MPTNLDVIARAMRAMGVIRAGQVPEGADATDGLQHFQDIVDNLPLFRKGEWTDVVLTSASTYEASDGERITTAGYAATITLPTTYENDDGDTVPQRDLSRVQIIGASHSQAGLWIFSASNGSWAQVDDLELDGEFPFGPEDVRGVASMIAVSMVDEYGAEIAAVTTARAGNQAESFRARFYRDVTVKADPAFYVSSEMGWAADIEDVSG